MVEKGVVILRISGARAIFLLICNSKTLIMSNENWKLAQFGRYSPIKISKALWENDIHSLEYGREKCGNSSYLWS